MCSLVTHPTQKQLNSVSVTLKLQISWHVRSTTQRGSCWVLCVLCTSNFSQRTQRTRVRILSCPEIESILTDEVDQLLGQGSVGEGAHDGNFGANFSPAPGQQCRSTPSASPWHWQQHLHCQFVQKLSNRVNLSFPSTRLLKI